MREGEEKAKISVNHFLCRVSSKQNSKIFKTANPYLLHAESYGACRNEPSGVVFSLKHQLINLKNDNVVLYSSNQDNKN